MHTWKYMTEIMKKLHNRADVAYVVDIERFMIGIGIEDAETRR